jgi:hypothetical protein
LLVADSGTTGPIICPEQVYHQLELLPALKLKAAQASQPAAKSISAAAGARLPAVNPNGLSVVD